MPFTYAYPPSKICFDRPPWSKKKLFLSFAYFDWSLENKPGFSFFPSFPCCTGSDSKFDFKVLIEAFISSMYRDSISLRTNFGINLRFWKSKKKSSNFTEKQILASIYARTILKYIKNFVKLRTNFDINLRFWNMYVYKIDFEFGLLFIFREIYIFHENWI